MSRGQEVRFPTSAPDSNEEIGSIDLNHSTSLIGTDRNTLSLFPDVPASYAPPRPQNHAQGAPKYVFGMPSYSQAEVKPMMVPQNYLQEVPLPATATAGELSLNAFFEENVNRCNQYTYLDPMIPEDKMMAIPQINDLEKPRIEMNTMATASFMDGLSLVHDVSGESTTTGTKTRPGTSANKLMQAEIKSENVPTLGLGAGSYMVNRPRDDVSIVGSTGAIEVDRSSFSSRDMGFSNFGNDLDLFTRSQPNVGGVAFQSGLSIHYNEDPHRPQNDDHRRLLQNFSGFPQPAENGMLPVENFDAFLSNPQNIGSSSRLPPYSNADTLSPFVFEPHAYQIPANWNLDLQGYRAAPPSEGSHSTDGFWGSLADLPGLHSNNKVSFLGGCEQSDLARFPSSTSLIHRGMQPDSFQTKHPYFGTHNDFSPGSDILSPSMGVTRSINSSQELTDNVGLRQAIATVQPTRDAPTTTYGAGISSTPSSFIYNVPAAVAPTTNYGDRISSTPSSFVYNVPAAANVAHTTTYGAGISSIPSSFVYNVPGADTAASGSVSVGPPRKRSVPKSGSDTQQAACKKTKSLNNAVQSSPSVAYRATTSVASPGWNAQLSAFPDVGSPMYPPRTSTASLRLPQVPTAGLRPALVPTAGLRPAQVPTAGLHRPQVPSAGLHLPQVRIAGLHPPQVPTAGLHHPQVPTAGLRPPQVSTAGLRPPQVSTAAVRPHQAPRTALPQSRAAAVPLNPPPRAPAVVHRRPPVPNMSRSLPSASTMEHIRWQGPEGNPTPCEYKCLLCMRDLPFSPEGAMVVPRIPPPVSVLPCHHQFHTHCLDLITPPEQAANPPCLPCAMGGTIK